MRFDPSRPKAFLLRHLPAVCFGAALLLFLVFGGLLLRQALGGGQPQPPSLPASSASFPAASAASAEPNCPLRSLSAGGFFMQLEGSGFYSSIKQSRTAARHTCMPVVREAMSRDSSRVWAPWPLYIP